MQTLKHSFTILQFLGLWRSTLWQSGWKINLYNSYSWLMVFLMTTDILSQLIELMNYLDDIEALINGSFILLTMIGNFGKGANILMRRNEIIELTNVLLREPCLPKTKEEIAIQHKFDRLVRSNTLYYAGLMGITVSALVLKSFAEDIPRRSLPLKVWLPFDHRDSLLGYSIAYSHQIVTLIASTAITASFDTLVAGLMLQTCAQLNILEHRFQETPKALIAKDDNVCSEQTASFESQYLSQHVNHHLEIFKFAQTTNDLFSFTIFLQYTISTLVLCVSVLELSKVQLFTSEFTWIVMYLACMISQIFIFCFYGTEVTVESINIGDAIYDMDWTVLSTKSRRSLLTIMMRSLRPIKFTSIKAVTLNLESFSSVRSEIFSKYWDVCIVTIEVLLVLQLIKLSYSAYNVLQQ